MPRPVTALPALPALPWPARPRRLWLALLVTLLAQPGAAAAQDAVVHAWQRIYYAPLDGKESLLFVERFDRAKPALADIDGDGDLDLFLGAGDGRVMYFENQGTAKAPRWHLANPAIPAQLTPELEAPAPPIDVGENAAPALVDIDGDGDLDLFVGSAAGRLAFFRNEGNRFLPTFRRISEDFLGIPLGLNLVAKFPDLNADGLPDLSVGNEAGEYFIALNQGTRAAPRFCVQPRTSPECLSALQRLGKLDPEDNAVPEWTDWDRDGDLDLLVGKSDGTIAYFQNIGTRQQGAWELAEARFNLMDAGGFAAPVFADVNGDGAPDLLLAGDGEQVALYSGRPDNRQFPLWVEDKNALRIRRLGGIQSRLHVAAGDLDGDGDADLVVGSRGGDLLVYENVGTAQAPAFRSPDGPLLPTPQRAFAAPALVDLDGDGDLDLVVGGREGRLEWIENTGSPRQPRWSERSLFFGRVDVGSLSVPLFTDLDGDGDADLLVGNATGIVVYYENVGTPKAPEYALRTLRFAGVRVANNAAPTLFGWNPAGAPDLVVGSQGGTLTPAVRNPAVKAAERGAFRLQRPWGGGLQGESYSAPLFVDLTGDTRADLLLGTGTGALLFWRYEGSGQPAQMARLEPRGSNVVQERLTSTDLLAPGSAAGAAGAGAAPAGVAAALTYAGLPLDPIFVYEPSPLEKLALGRITKPVFYDANGDGRLDLVVGTREGKLVLLESGGGDRRDPTWRAVTDAFAGYDGSRNAAPVFVDVDGDGDLDLVVGNEDGQVRYWENAGSRTQPRFAARHELFAGVRVGKNAVPAFVDLDGDGRPDLLAGNLRGELLYYANRPGPRISLEMRRFIGLDVGVNASPSVADLTRRNEPFLVIGSDQGAIAVYGPTGTSRLRSSGWKENRGFLEGLLPSAGSHAALGDVDGDGDLDLVLGSDAGTLRFYRNQAVQPELAPGQR